MLENTWIPDHIKTGLTPRQADFLAYEGREALYGGAAGGGKSVALLAAALQYVDVPGYSALILRRTYAQLAKSDSILNKAKDWLMPFVTTGKLRWNGDERKFTFPAGTTLEFGHMDHEDSVYNYQGGIWPFIGVDEATQFTPTMLSYPRTRQRRPTGSLLPMRWRGASNPGGVGHEYVKHRYIRGKDHQVVSDPDRRFFPATIDDNPNIDREDYIRQLREAGIDALILAQLLHGDWDAVAGGRFKSEWFRYYRNDPIDRHYIITPDGERFTIRDRPIFQTCDPAASTSADADSFVISTWCLSPRSNLLWLDCHVGKYEIEEQLSTVQRLYRMNRAQFVAVEEVLNQRALAQMLRRSTDPVMNVKSVSPLGKKKVERAIPVVIFVQSGRLLLPEDSGTFPLDDVRGHLVRFTGEDGQPDDIFDTLAYAVDSFRGYVGTACMPQGAGTTATNAPVQPVRPVVKKTPGVGGMSVRPVTGKFSLGLGRAGR